jgi:hypothetical protein
VSSLLSLVSRPGPHAPASPASWATRSFAKSGAARRIRSGAISLRSSAGQTVRSRREERLARVHEEPCELGSATFYTDGANGNEEARCPFRVQLYRELADARVADRGNWVVPSVVGFVTSQSDSRGCRASSLSSTWTLITRLAPAARLGGKVTAAAPCGASIPNAANTPRTWGQDG